MIVSCLVGSAAAFSLSWWKSVNSSSRCSLVSMRISDPCIHGSQLRISKPRLHAFNEVCGISSLSTLLYIAL